VDFHFVLPLITRNAIFIAIHEATLEWLTDQRVTGLLNPGEDRLSFSAHEAIYEGIEAHDPDRAERAMLAHMDRTSEVYWQRKHLAGEAPAKPRARGVSPRRV
jgi:DNA-binding FadR family transcriptional regulator